MLTLHRVIKPGAARGTVLIDRLELDALIEASIAPASVLQMNTNKAARRQSAAATERAVEQ